MLNDQEIQQIHQTSMKLLENVGVEFPHPEALEVLGRHGVRVEGSRAYWTEGQLLAALESVPKQFTIQARNPERNVTVGGGEPVFAPCYGAPFLVDATPGGDGLRWVGKRAPTMDDYVTLVKLVDALPNQDMSGHLLVEPAASPVRMLHAHMVHSDKAFIGSAAGKEGAEHTLRMARILFGDDVGTEAAGEKYVTISLINSLSPLGYSTEMLDALLTFARARQPLVIAALMMAGSTGPITLAGVLAAQTAELLAGIALTQLVSPGTPAVFGSTSTNIDMKSGALAIGSPELSQMIAAHADLARFYKLPSRSGGALTDASFPDAQAGFESMMSLLTTVNSGVDFVLHAGGILTSYLATSIEKLVLDDEMCGMVRRFRQGLVVGPDTLAYDVVAKVGPGGNFLTEPQTVKRCRKEFWRPDLCDRAGLEAWTQGGQRDAVERARTRWQKLVAEHVDPTLDATTARQLQEYVEAATR